MEKGNSVTFANTIDKDIRVLIEWETGGITRTLVKAGEEAALVFDQQTAVICHRSDGGDYGSCPDANTVAKAGDHFRLGEDGSYV